MATSIIDSYQFGEIVVSGKKYTSDVIIFPNRVSHNWWRKSGHQLCLEDIAEVIAENPEVMIVGIGGSGLVKVLPEIQYGVESQGIKLIVENTDKACHTYNQLCCVQRVVAALHLTC
ncbi:Mth938-like domain-containing protein [Chloroflexota bacterium]